MLLPAPRLAAVAEPVATIARASRQRAVWSIERLLLLCSLFWVLAANRPLLGVVMQDQSLAGSTGWATLLSWVLGLTALHALLLAALATRHTVRPLLAVLIVATAFAAYFTEHPSVVLDPTMLRNVLRTDAHEAAELFSAAMLGPLALLAGLPLLLLWRVQPLERPWRRALPIRLGFMALMAALLVACVLAQFAPLASLMRNHKQTRYLITPANVLWSLAAVASADTRSHSAPRQPIGEDARLASPAPRPTLVVLVVGETARAANWGLSGYARDTTPQLARLPVINFADVTSCGTNTETSLPCLFAPVGRRDYDERRIRSQQSLLQLLARAGVGVTWRDNQSGCKGVCDGLVSQAAADLVPAAQCPGGRCFDEALLGGLPEMLRQLQGTQLLVLHPIGNHGPAYFKRYPRGFTHFQPACEHDDLRLCSREQVVNAYDNALRYTDHWLAQLVHALQAAQGRVDSALVFVSDHGESLGESNLWLHGLPYAIAPDVQKKVPMVMWFSDGFARQRGLDLACLRDRARHSAAHDHLFHTLLGLLDVRTKLHEAAWDLGAGCQRAAAP